MVVVPLLLALGAPPTLVDVAKLDKRFRLDIKYATEDNFFGKKVYPEARCLLRPEVAERVVAAQKWLDAKHPGYVLLFKDCYRPNHVQHVLWDAVKGTKKSAYVANPNTKTGSIHSYGAAVDLTLVDAEGKEVDMGTPYDHLGKLAEPRHEARFVRERKLTARQVANRRILRDAMTKGGQFKIIRNEWWHFNAAPSKVIRKKYERLDLPFSAVD
ncbi:MAG: M15 family metallopeptidase [Deltaproteobacteria bacterium]|jgi:D-alanyl-D-alanine dipeptidase